MKNMADLEISDLEKEIELEMDDSANAEQESDDDSGAEMEMGDDGESGEDKEFEAAIEDSEFESTDSGEGGDQEVPDEFAERFYELSTREFEDESDVDREVSGLLNEMERQFFFGSFKKLLKKGLKYGAKGLLKKAMKYGKGLPAFKAFKGITQLVRGDLRGALGTAASALLRMNPAAAAGLTALKGLGFNPLGDAETNRQAWNNYTSVVREAYDHLAENLSETSDEPLEASRQAATAFQTALRKVQNRTPVGVPQTGKVHRIRVRPGQKITIIIEGI